MKVWVEIKTCQDCPHCYTQRTPRSGFAYDYFCKPLNRKIVGYVEWEDEIPTPPDWCPCRVKE